MSSADSEANMSEARDDAANESLVDGAIRIADEARQRALSVEQRAREFRSALMDIFVIEPRAADYIVTMATNTRGDLQLDGALQVLASHFSENSRVVDIRALAEVARSALGEPENQLPYPPVTAVLSELRTLLNEYYATREEESRAADQRAEHNRSVDREFFSRPNPYVDDENNFLLLRGAAETWREGRAALSVRVIVDAYGQRLLRIRDLLTDESYFLSEYILRTGFYRLSSAAQSFCQRFKHKYWGLALHHIGGMFHLGHHEIISEIFNDRTLTMFDNFHRTRAAHHTERILSTAPVDKTEQTGRATRNIRIRRAD